MAPILKLNKHDAKKEMEFELKYLKFLSVKKRFEIMFKKTKEMINLLARHGHRKPFEIITGRPQDLEDLKYLKKLKKL